MKELSIFVDESGDFGEYAKHSPFYIISLVLHDQDKSINGEINYLEEKLANMGYPNHCIHTGPLIRQEDDYRYINIDKRRKLMKSIMAFFRKAEVSCKSVYINKNEIEDRVDATGKLAKSISAVIREQYEYFLSFDKVIIYYDNGQIEVNKILSSVFNTLLDNVEFRKVYPSDYRLFQVADLVCTLSLVEIKLDANNLSKSEKMFFKDERTLKKNYLKPYREKQLSTTNK